MIQASFPWLKIKPTYVTTVLLSAALAMGCAEPAQVIEEDLLIGEEMRSWVAGQEPAGAPLMGEPLRLAKWRDSLAIIDIRPKQIVLLNKGLTGGRSFGRAGRGPGELAMPVFATAYGGELWVSDLGNRRLTQYSPEGSPNGAILLDSSTPGGRFVPLTDSTVLLPVREGGWYLIEYSTGKDPQPRVPRLSPEEGPLDTPLSPRRFPSGDFVVKTPGGFAVVDGERNTVIRGDEREVIPLPDDVREELQARMDSALDRIPGTERIALSKITRVSSGDDGILLWFFGREDIGAALLHHDNTWSFIGGIGELGRVVVRDVMIWDDEIYVLTEDGVRVYSLEPPDSG